jgi:general secretion pathway protein D
MTFLSRFARPLALAALVALVGCAPTSNPVVRRTSDPLIVVPRGDEPAPPGTVANGAPATVEATRPPPQVRIGTGQVINERAASVPAPGASGAGEATFNFEGESLHAVVKAILGDLLQQNYVIAPGVQGTVTLATPRPVDAAQALSLLEMVLGWNNARLVWADGRYNVVPSDQALIGVSPRAGSASGTRGFEVRAVPLRYIAAAEMEKLLKPYARPNAIVQVDPARNLIVLSGSRAELQNYLRTIEIFDVDWLSGMSVGVFPLQSAEASKVVTELEKVFGEGSKTPVAGMFRFMPLEGTNSVMVITPQASYLRQVEEFIERMDAGGEGARLYVYEVKNVKASDLAEQLSVVYGNATPSSGGDDNAGEVMPGLEPVEVRTTDMPPAGGPISPISRPPAAPSGGGELTIAGGEVGISAVEESNSLLVRASPAQWESIRRAIERLDSMPMQVHIEAQVVEVKLAGQLRYGVSWFFGHDVPDGTGNTPDWQSITNVTSHIRNYGTTLAGAANSFTFLGPSAAAIINTLDKESDVRVLSAPSVLVRSNVTADFQSGQQIPVESTIINNGDNTNTNNAYSQVQFRQTGVSLKVKPRVSADGMVFLEIDQDVSSPSTSGPTVGNNVSVDNNKLHTEVAVQDGETVMIAGLIKTEQGRGSAGFPGLSRLPVIGALFGQQSRTDNRSELVVLITPQVVRDPADARRLTDEYGARFKALEPLRKEKARNQR